MSIDNESSGMHVTFINVSYSIKRSQKTILHDVTGFLRPKERVALLGPSGSGKTTLLDILAGRKTVGSIEGSILFDQQKPTKPFLRRYTGYVEQQDTLISNMTVEEVLRYTCYLKSPLSETKESKLSRVERVIKNLSLDTCRKIPVGSAVKRGISGGQLKRANIGLALVAANPKVLFLDEPTTGLDSFTAAEVMDTVRHLTATTGITVCATIHSPSEYVFNMFDRVLVLVEGRVVHFGPDLTLFASMIHHGIPFSEHNEKDGALSKAEWLIDAAVSAQREGKAIELADAYAASELASQNEKDAKHFATAPLHIRRNTIKMASVKQSTETPWWYSLYTLLRYRGKADFRDPEFAAIRIMDKLLVQIIILTLYLNVGNDLSMANNPNIVAATFMFVILSAYTASGYVITILLHCILLTVFYIIFFYFNLSIYRIFQHACYTLCADICPLLFSTAPCTFESILMECTHPWFTFYINFVRKFPCCSSRLQHSLQ